MGSGTKTVYRADVVGWMLRPRDLVDARAALRAGHMGGPEYRAIEDAAVDAALRIQQEAGVDVATDGEMRGDTFFDFFVSGAEGLSPQQGWTVGFRDADGAPAMEVPILFVVTDRLRPRRSPGLDEYLYAREQTDELPEARRSASTSARATGRSRTSPRAATRTSPATSSGGPRASTSSTSSSTTTVPLVRAAAPPAGRRGRGPGPRLHEVDRDGGSRRAAAARGGGRPLPPLERLAIGTQCGFASAAEMTEQRRITEETHADKLRLVAETARAVWG